MFHQGADATRHRTFVGPPHVDQAARGQRPSLPPLFIGREGGRTYGE